MEHKDFIEQNEEIIARREQKDMEKRVRDTEKLVITDNSAENVNIQWDGERFAITGLAKSFTPYLEKATKVIILNPVEAITSAAFVFGKLRIPYNREAVAEFIKGMMK